MERKKSPNVKIVQTNAKVLVFGLYQYYSYFMSTVDRPYSYFPGICRLAHNDCLPGATNDELAEFFGRIADESCSQKKAQSG